MNSNKILNLRNILYKNIKNRKKDIKNLEENKILEAIYIVGNKWYKKVKEENYIDYLIDNNGSCNYEIYQEIIKYINRELKIKFSFSDMDNYLKDRGINGFVDLFNIIEWLNKNLELINKDNFINIMYNKNLSSTQAIIDSILNDLSDYLIKRFKKTGDGWAINKRLFAIMFYYECAKDDSELRCLKEDIYSLGVVDLKEYIEFTLSAIIEFDRDNYYYKKIDKINSEKEKLKKVYEEKLNEVKYSKQQLQQQLKKELEEKIFEVKKEKEKLKKVYEKRLNEAEYSKQQLQQQLKKTYEEKFDEVEYSKQQLQQQLKKTYEKKIDEVEYSKEKLEQELSREYGAELAKKEYEKNNLKIEIECIKSVNKEKIIEICNLKEKIINIKLKKDNEIKELVGQLNELKAKKNKETEGDINKEIINIELKKDHKIKKLIEELDIIKDEKEKEIKIITEKLKKEKEGIRKKYALLVKALNSDKYGQILDETLRISKEIENIKTKENSKILKDIVNVFNNLKEFAKDFDMKPILNVGEVIDLKHEEIGSYEYIGSSFESDEQKKIRVIASGWKCGELIITPPTVKEVEKRKFLGPYIGLDIGSSNSVLATMNKNVRGEMVSAIVSLQREKDFIGGGASLNGCFDIKREKTLPSYVYYRLDRDNGRYVPVVGDFAKSQYYSRPNLVVKGIKCKLGDDKVEGLDDIIQDKTPSEVASRLLKHMLKDYRKLNNLSEIKNAVITVPANFNTVMRKSLIEAGKLAKLESVDILSEAEAIIYSLYEECKCGNIASDFFDKNSNLLIIDIGGQTIDVTLNKVELSNNNKLLNINTIATNEYTVFGGDDFDSILAENMYERYLKQYSKNENVLKKITNEKYKIMPKLINYAEVLKKENSKKYDDINYVIDINCDVENGYYYSDEITIKEIEEIMMTYMGVDLKLLDYKSLQNINNKKNIVYPILESLAKASNLLGDDIKIDAVILNGGMSKFYMVKERIKKLFGFEPFIFMEPELTVAKGAAVYHYLNSNE